MVVAVDCKSTTSTAFIGMNLSEACNAATIQIEQLIGDLKMQSILDEYAFLLESGEELKVVTKRDQYAAKAREVATRIIDRIVAALKAFKEKVFALLDKAIIAFQDKINAAKILPMYPKYKKNFEVFKHLHGNARELGDFYEDCSSVVFRNIKGDIYSIFDNDLFYLDDPLDVRKDTKIHTANNVYSFYVQPKGSMRWSTDTSIALFDKGIEKGFNTKWSMNFIKEYKNKIDRNISRNIVTTKKYNNTDATELLDAYSTMMKNNINVVHGYIKVWSRYVTECIHVIKAVSNDVDDKTVDFIDA